MKKIVYTTMVALLLVACSKESDDTGSGTGGGGESGGVTEVTLGLDGQSHYRQGMLPAGRECFFYS